MYSTSSNFKRSLVNSNERHNMLIDCLAMQAPIHCSDSARCIIYAFIYRNHYIKMPFFGLFISVRQEPFQNRVTRFQPLSGTENPGPQIPGFLDTLSTMRSSVFQKLQVFLPRGTIFEQKHYRGPIDDEIVHWSVRMYPVTEHNWNIWKAKLRIDSSECCLINELRSHIFQEDVWCTLACFQ